MQQSTINFIKGVSYLQGGGGVVNNDTDADLNDDT